MTIKVLARIATASFLLLGMACGGSEDAADSDRGSFGANAGLTFAQGSRLAGGLEHTLRVSEDGRVWASGRNGAGQLGDGTYDDRLTPVAVRGLTGVVSVAAGVNHSLALRDDGSVWSWGSNVDGKLGDGTTTSRNLPAQVLGLPAIVAISAGGNNSFALAANGRVWSWGGNAYGHLGQTTSDDTGLPAEIEEAYSLEDTFPEIVAISSGYNHVLALDASGAVWAWGRSQYGATGTGANPRSNAYEYPERVRDLVDVRTIAAGGGHSLAVRNDGTLWAWGHNGQGALGDGSSTHKSVPQQVPGVANVSAIAAGGGNATSSFSIAALADGTLLAWGHNVSGQLGNGGTENVSVPSAVSLAGVAELAAGGNHVIARMSNGTLWAWGSNLVGQFGNGNENSSSVPLHVVGLGNTVAIAAGYNHTLALLGNGKVWAWGNNSYGQLGVTTHTPGVPVEVFSYSDSFSNIVAVSAGTYFSLALGADGTVWSWGLNNFGQLGLGSSGGYIGYAMSVGLSDVIAISAGSHHALALCADGTIWAWGSNSNGELGAGPGFSSPVPQKVPVTWTASAIAAGREHSLAIRSNGRVYAWGRNQHGQLGNGNTTNSSSPVLISTAAINNIVAVDGGSGHTLALRADGQVFIWGDNQYGQLGVGSTIANSSTPLTLWGLQGVEAIEAGYYHSHAIRSNGVLWAWGSNAAGVLGNGVAGGVETSPVRADKMTGMVGLAGGESFSIGLRWDGTLWSWGTNYDGQLGDGTTVSRPLPAPIVY